MENFFFELKRGCPERENLQAGHSVLWDGLIKFLSLRQNLSFFKKSEKRSKDRGIGKSFPSEDAIPPSGGEGLDRIVATVWLDLTFGVEIGSSVSLMTRGRTQWKRIFKGLLTHRISNGRPCGSGSSRSFPAKSHPSQ